MLIYMLMIIYKNKGILRREDITLSGPRDFECLKVKRKVRLGFR